MLRNVHHAVEQVKRGIDCHDDVRLYLAKFCRLFNKASKERRKGKLSNPVQIESVQPTALPRDPGPQSRTKAGLYPAETYYPRAKLSQRWIEGNWCVCIIERIRLGKWNGVVYVQDVVADPEGERQWPQKNLALSICYLQPVDFQTRV